MVGAPIRLLINAVMADRTSRLIIRKHDRSALSVRSKISPISQGIIRPAVPNAVKRQPQLRPKFLIPK